MKFLFGLFLGLAIGGTYFHWQARKIDTFSFRVAYITGHLEQADDDGVSLQDTVTRACDLYTKYKLDEPPFGYTAGPADHALQNICLKP